MKKDDIPRSATDNWQLWKLCETLTLEEISVLITKRKNDLKYEKDKRKETLLKTDMSILVDAYEIIKRRKE